MDFKVDHPADILKVCMECGETLEIKVNPYQETGHTELVWLALCPNCKTVWKMSAKITEAMSFGGVTPYAPS